ncbi:DUF3347 domain-containing protein [Mesonia sp.]|uniref:DUF3347 domain-containing protein n=1 Tax=Mesonia sp. TaxID=1960830 RepID=UPI00176A7798|nr:DUF3347 domain-containing protein [Mesonia sp.]HIB36871.1 DUF3347 domain-containing protein [Mesonia sp.]HIO26994.1 DUF3347 domain-containing protein [Flavobacteriaceae bacterium]
MKRTILCISLLALSLTACKNDAKSNEEATSKEKTEQTKEENTEDLPLAFNSEREYQTARLYLDLKDKLVKGDSYGAKKIAEIMVEKFNDSDMKSLAQEIAKNEENIEDQRSSFFKLSEVLGETFTANITGGKLYKQYCPMAFNGDGAFWFSTEEEIMNPYFGDRMLHCGKVEEIIK